jgi:undecaprenyl-diphosphatase
MDNTHLFELLNAGPGLAPTKLLLATLLAKWLIVAVPVIMAWAWVCGSLSARAELLEILLAVVFALAVAQIVALAWPQPRPFTLHLGTQYLAHADDPGLPSDHVTVFWSLALSALLTRRFAPWGFPLLAVGLTVGWSRVYLGVHFPYDIFAALPVALAGALAAHGLRHRAAAGFTRLLDYDDRWRSAVGGWFRRPRRP